MASEICTVKYLRFRFPEDRGRAGGRAAGQQGIVNICSLPGIAPNLRGLPKGSAKEPCLAFRYPTAELRVLYYV